MTGDVSGYVAPDPGLQVERTGLAWVRTSASVGVVGLLLLRWLPSHGLLVVAPTLVAFAVAAWLRLTARSHYQWGLGVVRDHGPDGADSDDSDDSDDGAGNDAGAASSGRNGRDCETVDLHTTAHPGRVLLLLTGVASLAAVGVWVMFTGTPA